MPPLVGVEFCFHLLPLSHLLSKKLPGGLPILRVVAVERDGVAHRLPDGAGRVGGRQSLRQQFFERALVERGQRDHAGPELRGLHRLAGHRNMCVMESQISRGLRHSRRDDAVAFHAELTAQVVPAVRIVLDLPGGRRNHALAHQVGRRLVGHPTRP